MKRVVILLLCLCLCLGGCTQNPNVDILSNPLDAVDYYNSVKSYAGDLYATADSITGFSIVGTESDRLRTEYVRDKFNEIGLSDVQEIPIMLNSWTYEGLSISSFCNCADNSEVTMRVLGTYPSNYEYSDTYLTLHLIENTGDLTKENIEGYAVLLPVYESMEDLEKAISIVLEYNPSLILTNSTVTNINNLYHINTNYLHNVNVPVVSLPSNSYDILKNYFHNSEENETDLELRLNGSSKVSTELTESNLVVGEIKGKSDKVVYVTSHHDTVHHGYMGSCISTAELLTIAERLVSEGYKPEYTIRFLVTTGQEWGLNGQGQNVGIKTYLSSLSDEEKSKIQSVLVLDGSYPFTDSIFSQVNVSKSLLDMVTEYDASFFEEYDVKFINSVVGLEENINYITEVEVWNSYDIPVILSAEMGNSRFVYNDTSLDIGSLAVDEGFLNYYINYYLGLVKIMSK